MRDTKERYRSLRCAAHRFSMEQFKHDFIEIRDIGYSDAVHADKWRSESVDRQEMPAWSWERMYKEYQSNAGIKRYEAALIANGVLCALCYGVPTGSKLTLRLHGIAMKPTNNPLAGKILDILLLSANAYARILKCKEIGIFDPMNETVARQYQKFAYTPRRDRCWLTTHLTMPVNMDAGDGAEILSEAGARAILEECKDQMLQQYDINGLLAPESGDLSKAYSMLAGPKTELGFRRILRDIKKSGNND
jgi:hypothetical protein